MEYIRQHPDSLEGVRRLAPTDLVMHFPVQRLGLIDTAP